ncbi:hypothetical protein FS749_007839 [Ceratobasidium sp. UAMH 11750]|nr:hypothetical protein FS749_007839 [Ceratobasidium sp. UAMH 11750]
MNASRNILALQEVYPSVTAIKSLDFCEQDKDLHFADGNVTIKVESTLFQLHEYRLQDFGAIAAHLSVRPARNVCSVSNDQVSPASSHAVVTQVARDALGLNGLELLVDAFQFRSAMNILYYQDLHGLSMDPPSLSGPELIAGLRFATQFGNLILRQICVRFLEGKALPPLEYSVLSEEMQIAEWQTNDVVGTNRIR